MHHEAIPPDSSPDASLPAAGRRSAALHAALAALAPAVLLAPLLRPGRLLMVRDLAFFHLPLRQVLVDLLRAGELPEWNRWIHGGQPILSNPNYAAFYPPSWLALAVPVPYALQLLVLLHAALAFWGAWRLLRRLGCAPPAAALGALGFAGSSWFLSLPSTFNFFCAMAWFPWALDAGLRALVATRAWAVAALAAGAALAAQLLAGEPVAVLLSALALACLGLTGAPPRARTLLRLLAVGVLAAALGAVQLLPTLHRLQGSARTTGMPDSVADRWSTPPARLVDLVLPRFWGDSTRDEEGLWLGWGLHDRDFPYVIALYSGLLPTILALVALLAVPIPFRAGWATAAGVGVLLALGRHDPLWEWLRTGVPLFGVLRYPEKFVVLTTAVVPLAGALAWQQLLAARERLASAAADAADAGPPAPRPRGLATAAAMAALFVLPVLALVAVALAAPARLQAFVLAHSGAPPTATQLAATMRYLRHEALVALAVAVATALLLALLARGLLSARRAGVLALLLLALDLLHYGAGLTPTLPRATMLTPPPAAAEARAAGGRTTSLVWLDERPEIGLRRGPPGFQQLWGRAQRLDPYVGTLWGLEYGLGRDYDLMLTPWGRHALQLLQDAWPRRDAVEHLLAAWDTGSVVVRREPGDLLREARATGRMPMPFAVVPVPARLPRFRFVEDVGRLDDASAAGAAVADLDLGRRDVCVGASAPPPATYAPGRVLDARAGQGAEVRYGAAGAAFLVAAITFDEGWEARLEDGREVPLCPTALGEIGVTLPGGEHVVRLRYRDPWVRVGAAVTGIALLLAALQALRGARRDPGAAALPVESAP